MEEMISIILPCYNQGIYLGEALESIIKQTYRNWEAIIVNDGSSDCTEEVALEYVAKDSRIHSCPEKFYHSVSCLGPSPSGTLVVRSV